MKRVWRRYRALWGSCQALVVLVLVHIVGPGLPWWLWSVWAVLSGVAIWQTVRDHRDRELNNWLPHDHAD